MHNHVNIEEEFIVDSFKKIRAANQCSISSHHFIVFPNGWSMQRPKGVPSLLVSLKQGGQGQVDQLDTHSLPHKRLQMLVIPKCLA